MTDATHELTVDRLGAAGDGLARLPDGRPAFLPGALPGERWRAREAGRRGEGVLLAPETLLAASPDRTAPPCAHAGHCGGCVLQHWAEAPYAAWKRSRLVEAMARAGFPDAPVAPTALTPAGRRRRADLAIRRGPGGITLGFHAAGSATVLDLTECAVLDPRLAVLLPPLRALLRGLPALRREGSAVLNLLDSGPDLLLRTDAALDAAGRQALAAFAGAHGLPRIAWAVGERGRPEVAAQLGPVGVRFAGVMVAPPPGAFLQASPEGEAAITQAVLAGLSAKLPAKAQLAELYAGIGTLSFPLAARARLVAFEGAAEAVAALREAANGARARIAVQQRDLARQPLLPAELKPFAAVVLDPPFAGAAEQIGLLARARVPRIIYVSCNPAALARDAAVLRGGGYGVLAATPIDQFRWSPHLEAVVTFGL